ncbi:MAG TPA: hypothetical protein VMV71_00250 [Candidatus Paceibacterota bacterium]|nr:hypothetical protein [Candidatus Paceibacterota bacterium]
MIGHEKLARDFKELSAKNNLANCYLFFGQPRVGKKLFALCFANYLEIGGFHKPEKVLADFLLIKPDEKGTVGIDEIRKLKNFLWQKPAASQRRTAVISDSEAMTGEAMNAILKIAEEPPESSLLIIIANDPERLPPTFQSRLQKIYFPPVPYAAIEKWLMEEIKCGAEQAKKFAEMSHGQPGLALMAASDENFESLLKDAEEFLKSGFWERRNVIKFMLENDNFDISRFLEAVLMVISKTATGKNSELWHKVSALRRDSESYNINPRLQLESLLGGV